MAVSTRRRPDAATTLPDGLQLVGLELGLLASFREVWRRRDFLFVLPVANLQAAHQSSILGQLWLLLNPLITAAIFYFVFGVLLRLNREIHNYALFLTVGILVYQYTSRAIMSGARSVTSNLRLFQAMAIPRSIMPISSTATDLLTFLPGVLVIVSAAVILGEGVRLTWLWLLPVVALQTIFNLGFAFITARLTYRFRDLQELLPHVLRMMMYLSGVHWSAEFIGERTNGTVQWLFERNPAYQFIAIARAAVYGQAVSWTTWVELSAWSLVLLLVGFHFFTRGQADYANEL